MYRRLGMHPARAEFGHNAPEKIKKLLHKMLGILITFRLAIISVIFMYFICFLLFPSHVITSQLELLGVNSIYSSQNDTKVFSFFKESAPKLNKQSLSTIEKRLNFYFPYDSDCKIENNIWQLWEHRADHKNFPKQCFPFMEQWRLSNTESNHNLITIKEAEAQIFNYFSVDMPEIVEAYQSLPDIRLKFEFLKYLLIYTSGGVYADIDTLNIIPVKHWYESSLKPSRLMVGVNIDYNDVSWDVLYNRRLSFSTKVFRAKAHHPFFAKLIARIVYSIFNSQNEIKSINWDKAFQNVDSNGEPLIQFISESIFTDTLFSYFNALKDPVVHRVARTEKDLLPEQIYGPETNEMFSYKLFTLAKGPTQVDDVVVMPQRTFRGPSNSVHKGVNNKDSIDKEILALQKESYFYVKSYNFLDLDLLVNEGS